MTEPGSGSRARLLERLEAFRGLGSAVSRSARAEGRTSRSRARSGLKAVKVAVVTDSAAALPAEWLSSAPGCFRHVALPVMVGDEIFSSADLADDDGQLLERLSLALATGEAVKTSRPSPATFGAVYRELADAGYQEIVSLHLSSGLSGTADAARLAAASAPVAVQVLDSRTAAMCLGFAVQAACVSAESGADAEEVLRAAAASLESSTVHFYVPSLEQLRRGGRIGGAASWLGTVLAIKPILGISDGHVVPVERVRSSPKALARLEELAALSASELPEQSLGLAVHHFGSEAAARELAGRLRTRYPAAPAPVISALPAVLAAHVGLGVLAIVSAQLPQDDLSP
ncbi:DegV family protein [Arthrobacter sp. NPDC090010]|uniref:DegV family protein n=1 Tax=Arthrobacter sp. NPDC090010 TaxID=3363942 RepID=UPI003828B26C